MNRESVPEREVFDRIREICLGFPEVEEKPFGGHSAPCFRVRNKIFVHLGEHDPVMTIKAGPGIQELLVGLDAKQFYVPPYVGQHGWIGVNLDEVSDWGELEDLIRDSYRLTAPKKLAREV